MIQIRLRLDDFHQLIDTALSGKDGVPQNKLRLQTGGISPSIATAVYDFVVHTSTVHGQAN